MVILEDLSPEERMKYLAQHSKSAYIEDNKKNNFYKIEYSSRFTINDQLITYMKVENILQIKLIHSTSRELKFDILVLKNEIKEGLDYFPAEYRDIILKMADIRNHVICTVNSSGMITQIHNMPELSEKWQILKRELETNIFLSKQLKKEDFDKILKSGDDEYTRGASIIVSELNQNIAFSALFTGFVDIQNNKLKRTYSSNIFAGILIDVDFKINEEYKEDATTTYSLTDQNYQVDEMALKKLFLKHYYLLDEKFKDYKFEVLSLNTIDDADKWVSSIRFTTSEKINESLYQVVICEIDKIENYE